MRLALVLCACVCAALSAARGAELGDVSGNALFDFRSAYYSRGKIVNTEPILPLAGGLKGSLGDFGYLGGNVFSVSAVSTTGQAARRRNAFHEVDLKPYYGYDWNVAEDWTLVNMFSRQWVLLPGYRNNHITTHEWQFTQRLKNPYVTPYYLFRHAFRGKLWNYWRVGLTRDLPLGYDLVLTPDVWCDLGDANFFYKQYGADTAGGLAAVNGQLRLMWNLSKHFSIHAGLQQFGVVSKDGRSALKKNTAVQTVTDLTIFTIGLAAKF